ncbi:MAG: type I-U CRISPR-associated protein Csb2 [Chromatiaceae bacterium]|jgi:CRISPR-associated protein Csb2|nr:type I-U CRISPR-associated protein Csb2 [Chromatiaceae bacterium]
MVTIRVDFLRGVYVAAEPTATETCEWPPAPARLFAALVSSAYAIGLDPAPLRALESAPEVRFADPLAAPGHINYVPAAFIGTSPKTKSADRPNRETRRPQMVGITHPVFYRWDADLDPAWLTPVLGAVTYLGRAESTVRVSLISGMPQMPNHLAPDPYGGELLRVPGENWLAQLQAHYKSPARLVAPYLGYSDPRVRVAPSPWGELFVLRPDGGELRDAVVLGEALRAATMSQAPEQMSPVLHGHERVPHAAWLTLPDIGHDHAQGRVLGVGMLLPKDVSEAARMEAVVALSRVGHIDTGRRLTVRRPASHEQLPGGIRRTSWARPADTWVTVTPIVLERHPRRGQSVESIIADTCERWGYPRPAAVETGQWSPLRGVPMAKTFRPRRPGRWTHAVLRWDSPVRGPVLLGRDQHFGLGLCRALREPQAEGLSPGGSRK